MKPRNLRINVFCCLAMISVVALAPAQEWDWEWAGPNPLARGQHVIWASHGEYMVPRFGGASLFVSSDGLVWRQRTRPGAGTVLALVTDGVRVLAVCTDALYFSDDGLAWTSAPRPTGLQPSRLVWADGEFLALSGQSAIWHSVDGVSWAQAWSGVDPLRSLAGGGGRRVAVGAGGLILTSVEGGPWTAQASGVTADLGDVTWTGERFVAVGSGGTILTSPDGASWAQVDSGVTDGFFTVHWTGSLLLAGGSRILVSEDGGATWSDRTPPPAAGFYRTNLIYGFASGGSRTVGLGRFLDVVTSADGRVWEDRRVRLQALAVSGDCAVAVGLGGVILASDDGRSFDRLPALTSADLHGVVWTGEAFVAVGDGGTVLRSSDGRQWEATDSGVTEDLRRVVWDGARLVAATATGGIAEAGKHGGWRLAVPPSGVRSVATNGRQVVAVGAGGLVLLSEHGGPWQAAPSGTDMDLLDIAWGAGEYLAVGRRGTLLASGDGRSWQPRRLWFRPPDGWSLPATGRDVTHVRFSDRTYRILLDDVTPLAFLSLDGEIWRGTTNQMNDLVRLGPREVALDFQPTVVWHRLAVEDPLLLPVAARLAGINETFWQTDVDLVNPGGMVAEVLLEYLPREGPPRTARRSVGPGRLLRLEDVVGQAFGASGAGALRITPLAGRVTAGSRTYTTGEAGTLGQGVPAAPVSGALRPGRDGRLAGLAQAPDRTGGFRTNLGLVNLADHPVEVTIRLADQGGVELGVLTESLPAARPVQLNEVLRPLAPEGVEHATATISVVTAGGAVSAYATVVDNRSGDTVFMRAR